MINNKESKITNRIINFIPYLSIIFVGITLSIFFYLKYLNRLKEINLTDNYINLIENNFLIRMGSLWLIVFLLSLTFYIFKRKSYNISIFPHILNFLIGAFLSIYFYLDFLECDRHPLKGGFLDLCGITTLFILWVWIFFIVHSLIFITLKKFYRYISYPRLYIISLLIGFVVFLVIVLPLGNLIAYLTGW